MAITLCGTGFDAARLRSLGLVPLCVGRTARLGRGYLALSQSVQAARFAADSGYAISFPRSD